MHAFKKSLPILLVSLFILFLYHFPDLYAYLKTPPGMSFSGQASWFDPWDINLYVSAIHSGQLRGFLLPNVYTTEPNSPLLLYPFYTTFGLLFPNISPFLLFHLVSIVTGSLLLLTLYRLLNLFLPTKKERLIALLLISLGGGVGWAFGQFRSADLVMTGFTFASSFQRPHEAVGMMLYFVSLISFYKGVIDRKNRVILASKERARPESESGTDPGQARMTYYFLTSFICLFCLIFFYPYYVLGFFVISGSFSLIVFLQKKTTARVFIPIILMAMFILPVTAGYIIHLQSNSTLQNVLSQTLKPVPILGIITGYAILLPYLVYQLIFVKKNSQTIFLNIWFWSSFCLFFIPFDFGRFYLRGLFFPGVVLCLLSLKNIKDKHTIFFRIITMLLLFLPISNFYTTCQRLITAGVLNHWYYFTQAEREAFVFLNQNSPSDSGVLAGYTIGNSLPANTHNRVYFGHLLQTPDEGEKFNLLAHFYNQLLPEIEAKEFLQKNHIRYVFWGIDELELAKITNKEKLTYPFLQPVFQKNEVMVYEVK